METPRSYQPCLSGCCTMIKISAHFPHIRIAQARIHYNFLNDGVRLQQRLSRHGVLRVYEPLVSLFFVLRAFQSNAFCSGLWCTVSRKSCVQYPDRHGLFMRLILNSFVFVLFFNQQSSILQLRFSRVEGNRFCKEPESPKFFLQKKSMTNLRLWGGFGPEETPRQDFLLSNSMTDPAGIPYSLQPIKNCQIIRMKSKG